MDCGRNLTDGNKVRLIKLDNKENNYRKLGSNSKIFEIDEEFDSDLKYAPAFLNHYIQNYNNFYSKRFKHLDLDIYKITNNQVYLETLKNFQKSGKNPFIVYEILDTETGWIRVGWSGHSPNERFKWYLIRAFSSNLSNKMANIYYEMAKCKSKDQASSRFLIKVRYLYPSKGEAQIMEEFLTIFRNRADNKNGYDLKINNEYNQIVGDLMKNGLNGRFLQGSLNPKWKNMDPISLSDSILRGLDMRELSELFSVSKKTIRRRFRSYGYGVKNTFDLKDARAFLLKPFIIEGFKKGLSQHAFFRFCEKEGIFLFKKFEFIPNKSNNRGAFFRRMLEQIWGYSRHKEARYYVISEYILSVIDKPTIKLNEAINKLSNIIDFKYNREIYRICEFAFNMDFRSKRDALYKPIIEHLSIKHYNDPKIRLKMAIDLKLCSENDPISKRERACGWIKEYVRRNYGLTVKKLPFYLQPNLREQKTIKEHVFETMEHNPIARPKDIYDLFEDTSTIETIRAYVKKWKKKNRNKIFEFTVIFAFKYIEELDLGEMVKDLTAEILKNYITIKQPSLNMEWKGIIAAAIISACELRGINICENILSKFINISLETIHRRKDEIKDVLTIL